MNKIVLLWLLVFGVSLSAAEESDLETAHYSAIPGECITASNPQDCFEANGYHCYRMLARSNSMAAYRLSCNARLSNGRGHFAQVLFDGTEWIVESQRVYIPEPVKEIQEKPDSRFYLDKHIERRISGHSHIGEGTAGLQSGRRLVYRLGLDRQDDVMSLKAICGSVVVSDDNKELAAALAATCQKQALEVIARLSQSDRTSPYRAAGKSELRWQESIARLESGEFAAIVEADYAFPLGHISCRLTSDCCSQAGAAFLNSCRDPDEKEKSAIDACLANGYRPRSVAYAECLSSSGVTIGCEDSPDGSRRCY